MNETRQLAQFVADTPYSSLPTIVVEHMRGYVLDNIACGLAGAGRPEPRLVAQMAHSSGARGTCFVFGERWRTWPSLAALVNGTAISALEADHGYIPGSCHPGAAVFPGALAIAQTRPTSGRAFLTALVLGYEALCRIGAAATRAVEDQRGFHGPGTNAAFGAAIAASKLLGLGADATTNALGIAGSHGCGLMEFVHEGAMTKRLHVARGSQMGLESASLAQAGFTGASTVLEGRFGFLHAYSPSPRLEELLRDLGRQWHMVDLLVRPFPCHGSAHGVVEVLSRFRAEHRPPLDHVTRLTIETGAAVIARHGDKAPTTVVGMQYSLPFCAAVALARDMGDPRVICEETVQDPAIRALASQVELVAVPDRPGTEYLTTWAKMVVEIKGHPYSFDISGYRGHPSRPCAWKDMVDKFFRFAGPVLGDKKARAAVSLVGDLDSVHNVQDLVDLIEG